MPYSRSLHDRLIELVQLLAGVPASVACTAVERAEYRRPHVSDPMDIVAESLRLIRSQAIRPAGQSQHRTYQFDENDPALIVLVDS